MDKLEKIPEGYIDGSVVYEYLQSIGLNPKRIYYDLLNKEFFSGAKIIIIKGESSRRWIIPEDSFTHFKSQYEVLKVNGKVRGIKPVGYLTIEEVAQRLGESCSNVRSLNHLGKFPHSLVFRHSLFIPESDVIEYEKGKIKHVQDETLPEGYIYASKEPKEYFQSVGVTGTHFHLRLIERNVFEGATQITRNGLKIWIVPKTSFEQFKSRHEIYKVGQNVRIRPIGYLTVQEVAVKLDVKEKAVRHLHTTGKFPNAIRELDNYLYIPPEDVDEYKRIKIEEELGITLRPPYDNRAALDDFSERIVGEPNKDKLLKTYNMFIDFARLTIKGCNGGSNTLKTLVVEMVNFWRHMNSVLYKELPDMIDDEVEAVLQQDFPYSHKIRLIQFTKYCDSMLGIDRTKKFFVTPTKNNKKGNDNDSDIYSAKIYSEYLKHVKDMPSHITRAIRSQSYANMWLYTIMHLTDAWRASDIVLNLPELDMDYLKIDSIQWFNKNELSLEDGQKVVNEVYHKLRGRIASKNKAFLNFFVTPDLVQSFGTSYIISELHRRSRNRKYVLHTFANEGFVKSAPKSAHLKFFENKAHLQQFSSLKMNRSTLTYLFYSIVDEDGEDADVALEFGQIMRSHKDLSTTGTYVHLTNKDGSINRVSLNLFRRGHFGWMYNYMIMLVNRDSSHRFDSISGRTKAIQSLRKDLSPRLIENWAKFINSGKKRRDTVLSELYQLSQEKLIELLLNIFQDKMPARTKEGQCMIYPKCAYPKLGTCFSCEYFIPKTYVLLEASKEFGRLIESIRTANHETTIIRDSKFIQSILLLVNEALEVYEDEYVEALIQNEQMASALESVADKLVFLD